MPSLSKIGKSYQMSFDIIIRYYSYLTFVIQITYELKKKHFMVQMKSRKKRCKYKSRQDKKKVGLHFKKQAPHNSH